MKTVFGDTLYLVSNTTPTHSRREEGEKKKWKG